MQTNEMNLMFHSIAKTLPLFSQERLRLIAQAWANMFMEQLRAKLKQKFSFCASQGVKIWERGAEMEALYAR